MQVEVSIIVATYNADSTLERALNSVLNQNFQNWECVIVDGASKDHTLSIAKGFCDKDKRFRLYSEPDKGVYDAFNKGWKRAIGEWIYYLGCDDELLPDGLKSLLAVSEGVDFVYGGIVRRYRNGSTKAASAGNFEKEMPYSLAASHQAMILKRSIIEEIGGFKLKYRILADYDLINNAYYNGLKTGRCEDCVAIFQLGGLSTDNISSLTERYKILVSYDVPKRKAFFHCLKMAFLFSMYKVKHRFL